MSLGFGLGSRAPVTFRKLLPQLENLWLDSLVLLPTLGPISGHLCTENSLAIPPGVGAMGRAV